MLVVHQTEQQSSDSLLQFCASLFFVPTVHRWQTTFQVFVHAKTCVWRCSLQSLKVAVTGKACDRSDSFAPVMIWLVVSKPLFLVGVVVNSQLFFLREPQRAAAHAKSLVFCKRLHLCRMA